MSQTVLEMSNNQPVAPAAARPLTSSALATPPAASSTSAASRAAKSGNGSGNNTTGILKAGSAAHQHHHNSHRATKRAGSTASSNSHNSTHSHTTHAHTHTHTAHSPGHSHDNDGRPKRVWKACERCRMKKTKCDGEFPCKRCKDDGLVCTAGTRKKTEYKQIPKGYAEVLENTQVALVATIHKLYAMVQSGQSWTLGEPELNERGQPVIHSIASKLGCIRPNNDPDLPFGSSIFPESDKDLNDLQSQLNDYHKQREAEQAAHPEPIAIKTEDMSLPTLPARKRLSVKAPVLMSASAPSANTLGFDNASASSPEDLENLSDMDDYRKNVFGRSNRAGSSVQSASTMSPQSLNFNDFESVATTNTSQADSLSATIPSPTVPTTQYANWMAQSGDSGMSHLNGMNGINVNAGSQQALEFQVRQRLAQQMQGTKATLQYLQTQPQQQQQQAFNQESPLTTMSMSTPIVGSNMTLLGPNPNFFTADMLQQGLFESNFGAIKPHIINTDAMLGGADPMIFDGGYDEPLM
ncbi:c6 zinc finger domain containing protein [Ophiostoma piceae UAMH 11346]|uniref:C6 zinc finger domain containing protein n=1 Tax=Ophiostoma piceae (strain UAMH 11346) TaxID=1262450 RepID=S3CGV8_OPHP1|nr:c6 zinc finger domain containing protein [Ophiostoma piceae UAMH 11346]